MHHPRPARSRATSPFLLGALLAALSIGTHPAADTPSIPKAAHAKGSSSAHAAAASVARLTSYVPDAPRFVLHGTVVVDPRPFDRFACPLRVHAPDGTELVTQWELVARLQDAMVVELRALVDDNRWSGRQTFEVFEVTPQAFDLSLFDLETLALLLDDDAIGLVLESASGAQAFQSLSGFDGSMRFHRFGPATVTLERTFESPALRGQSWVTIDARKKELEFVVNWHNGGLPASPDRFFRSLSLATPSGWQVRSLLPDPAVENDYLVKPDDHVLPQRMERSMRFIVHKSGASPDVSRRGWAVGDWSEGGYMAQDAALPNLDHMEVDLTTPRLTDYQLLSESAPTVPGDVPVSFMWPARGVRYGGMTGGIDIEAFPAVPLAVTGQPDGLLSLYVEQLRYASRHFGCIYGADGRPVVLDDYVNPDGSLPWLMFNRVFFGNPPRDEPFLFHTTGAGDGTASYDPSVFQPIDDQHLVRRTKANKALVWLDNDPLARLYLLMDAEISRMTYYEGTGGRIRIPDEWALGTFWGRAEGWAVDALVSAYAISDDAWRARNDDWFVSFVLGLYKAQMPNGLFSAIDEGKVPEDPPYGHLLSQPCPFGIHTLTPGSGQTVADFWAHRTNEQIHFLLGLRAIEETLGYDTSPLIRRAGLAIWEFAWKVGTAGPLERYPAGFVGGPRFTSRDEIPAGLTDDVPRDSYHVANALAVALQDGAPVIPAIEAYLGTSDYYAGLAEMESWGTDEISTFVLLLELFQSALP